MRVSEKEAMQNISTAFIFLTLSIHRRGDRLRPEHIGAAALYFPLVGLGLGLVLVMINRGLGPYLGSEILSVVIVAILIVATGGIHLAGLQKTFDSLGARPPMVEGEVSSVGIYGFLATLFVVLLKVRSVEVIGELLGLSLLVTPVLARWGLVMFLYGSTSTRDDTATVIARHVKTWHMLITSGATLAFAYFFAGRTALWIGLSVSLIALLGRSYLRRRHGGISCDNCGAVIELSEAVSFLFFASV